MSRGIPQQAETTYTAAVTPRVTSVPVLVSNHIALEAIARYVDTSADQTVIGDIPSTG